MTAFFARITECPRLYDGARGKDALASLTKALQGAPELAPAAKLLGESKTVRELLEAIFSASPYLTALALRHPADLAGCLLGDPDVYLGEARAGLAAAVAQASAMSEVMTLLRRFKHRMALLTGLAELGGVWPTEAALEAMSVTADSALEQATAFLFRKARESGQLMPQADPTSPAPGYFVIAMGKLGAFELNYSSDVDIVVFYDAERAGLKPEVEPSTFFVRLTRELVRLLQEHTADGYVFRTDLRLRPDPGATQIALSVEAGLTYYESFGQNWERAALIKARVVAGDVEAGEEFLRQLSPFVWRKYLDFAAVADIHAMKRRVHAFKGHGAVAVEGHNIKLGRGGIRDIEFFAQTQQLIAGGRHPELRTRGTIETLERLATGGWIGPGAAARPHRGLSLSAPHREPAANDRRPADPHHSRRAGGAGSRCQALGLYRYQRVRRRAARPVQAGRGPIRSSVRENPRAAAVCPEHRRRRRERPGCPCRSGATRVRQPRSRCRRHPRLAVGPLCRDAKRAHAGAVDRVPAVFARCVRPVRRTRSRARHVRQGDGRDARRAPAILPARRQSEPVAADRRHHGDGAAACPYPGPAAAAARCRARSGFLRRGAGPGQVERAGRRCAGRGSRLSRGARPRPHRRPRASFPHRRAGDLGHAVGPAGRSGLCRPCRDADRGVGRAGGGRAHSHARAPAGR